MIIGTLRVRLLLRQARSLKDKRQVVRSIKDRLHNDFNVSVVEIESQDNRQLAVLGLAMAGTEAHDVKIAWPRSSRPCECIRWPSWSIPRWTCTERKWYSGNRRQALHSQADINTATKILTQYQRLAAKLGIRLSDKRLAELDRLRDAEVISSSDLPATLLKKFPGQLAGLSLSDIRKL